MIKLGTTYLLSDPKQIPEKLITKYRLLLEPTIFDADELQKIIKSKNFSRLLLLGKNKGEVKTFHFPTENADYLNNTSVKKLLYNTIKELGENNVPYLVLHSNYFQNLQEFDHQKLVPTRKKYIQFYKKLGKFASSQKVTVCIENLPIIGEQGDDFDSIFVFPEDFKNLPIPGVKITWDLGHWAYTCDAYDNFSNYYSKTKKPLFTDYLKVKKNIEHFHFSSFKKGIVNNKITCIEGVIPQMGDYNQTTLINACKKIQKQREEISMTLEIRERNYYKRTNLRKTVEWFTKKVFNVRSN
ncbi:MAG: hypothetical protein ACYC5G_01470 [Candidatus Doudnabacteria bacterium]